MPPVVRKKPAEPRSSAPHRVRIVAGRWRGSRIEVPPFAAVRPTPDRVRETLFNWLQPYIAGAVCLDLCAGSGALGLEALSRGARRVTFVDREPRIVQHLAKTLERLHARDEAELVASDALRFLAGPPQPFDIVFLDPPFASDLLADVYRRLADGWLRREAFVYVECPADAPLGELPAGWSVHRSKRAGQVGYHLLLANAPT